jgi:hypothetical protein
LIYINAVAGAFCRVGCAASAANNVLATTTEILSKEVGSVMLNEGRSFHATLPTELLWSLGFTRPLFKFLSINKAGGLIAGNSEAAG